MNNLLLTAGIVFVLAAIVGGGIKASGFEIPHTLRSVKRQFLLGLVGAGFIVGAFWTQIGTSNEDYSTFLIKMPPTSTNPVDIDLTIGTTKFGTLHIGDVLNVGSEYKIKKGLNNWTLLGKVYDGGGSVLKSEGTTGSISIANGDQLNIQWFVSPYPQFAKPLAIVH